MYQQCRHIQTNGYRCRQIALSEKQFCYYHQNRQPRRRRSVLRAPANTQTYDYGAIPVADPSAQLQAQVQVLPAVELLFPEDTASIQINLYRIAVAQAENRIDTRTANSMTWNQQVCLINLARKPLLDAAPAPAATQIRSRSHSTEADDDDSETGTRYYDPANPPQQVPRPVHRVILTPDGDEIAPPVEILEDNEAEPIHHKGCPCRICAEKYRNHPPELHHANCTCGLCEEQEAGQSSEHRSPSTELPSHSEHFMDCHPEGAASNASGESRDLQFAKVNTTSGPEGGFEGCHPERTLSEAKGESRDLP